MKTRRMIMLITAALAGAFCIAALFYVQIYAAYAAWNTPVVTEKTIPLPAERGRIFDRSGVLLADNAKDGGRYYPLNTAVHLLGTLNSKGEAESGAELAFDDRLSGKDGVRSLKYITCRGETYLSEDNTVAPTDGEDVYLTIDVKVQQCAEEILADAARQYEKGVDYDTAAPPSGSAGAIVVCDPRSGEILAMASAPDFSLTDYHKDYDEIVSAPDSPLLNRATQGLYRPGSVFKTVTAIAALSEGAIDSRTRFFCGGELWLGGDRFSCMNSHYSTDVVKALAVSCNVFFYRTALAAGIEPINRFGHLFGLGEQPNFELPTLTGQLTEPELFEKGGFTRGQLIQAAIGQAKTQCTPLQLAFLAAAIGDRGKRPDPSVLLRTADREGNTLYEHQPSAAAVITDKNDAFSLCIQGMVQSTVYTYGEYALSSLEKPAALKTGTPQSPGGYDSAAVGFYPADDPETAFCIMLENGANAKNAVKKLILSTQQ